MNDNKRFTSTTLLIGTALLFGLMMTQSASAQLGSPITFTPNLGNLTMYAYSGTGADANSPVVVAMHGCQQTALQYVVDSGLIQVANQKKLHLIVPEQKTGFFGNHAAGCFNWFQSGDAMRGQGEAASIAQMVATFKSTTGNTGPVYASGFSAGGGMATVMLAAYADVFMGAVVHAGLPYRCATTVALSYPCMGTPGFLAVTKPGWQWGQLLEASNGPHLWQNQNLAIYHSEDDTTVAYSRMAEIKKQWENKLATVSDHKIATDIGHKVSVDGSGNCGTTGTYTGSGGVCAQLQGLGPVSAGGIGAW